MKKVPARLQPYLFAVLACLVLAGFIGYNLLREHDRSIDQARANTANIARLLEEHTRQSLRRVEALLVDARARVDDYSVAAPGSDPALQSELTSLLPNDGLVGAVSWLDADGSVIVSTASDSSAALSATPLQPWLRAVREARGSDLVFSPLWQNTQGVWQVSTGRSAITRGGVAGGALIATVDLRALQSTLDAIDTGGSGFVTLFSTDGWMLATSPRNEALLAKNWSDSPVFKEHLPRSPIGTVRQVVVRDGTERIYSYRALSDFPVVVSIGISTIDALAGWRMRVRWNALFYVLVAAALGFGAIGMSRSAAQREAAERASSEAARKTQAIVDHAADGILTCDPDARIESANRAAALMFGASAASLVGRPVHSLLPGLAGGSQSPPEVGRRDDGSEFPVEVALTDLGQGVPSLRVALVRDITERRRSEAAVASARDEAQRSERFLRTITDKLPLRIAYVDRELRYRFVNRAHCERFGLPREAIIGRTRTELTGEPLSPVLAQSIERVLAGDELRFEIEENHAGHSRVIETYLVPDLEQGTPAQGFYAASADVSERHAQKRRTEQALAERETLLREVYHRVKNNLQVVQSLLNLQRRGLPEGAARSALDDSMQRVHAMALVHEKLYQASHLDAVSLHDYVTDLLRHLGDAAGCARRGIVLSAEVEPIEASIEVAVPFALLVTELVGNSLKHAFPEGRGGTVRVRVGDEDGAGEVWLHVDDDGVGLPAGFELSRVDSMGLQLAASLAGQLGGRLAAGSGAGAGARFSTALARLQAAGTIPRPLEEEQAWTEHRS